MSQMEILDVTAKLKEVATEQNKAELQVISEEFKRGHFPNVLHKSKKLQDNYGEDDRLTRLLLIVEAACHAQTGDMKASAALIDTLYQDETAKTADDLILLSELSFMCDFKLSRRIITQAVKQMEETGETNRIKQARAYLVLGETEENLEKFKRAAKYYQRALDHFLENDKQHHDMILFLHFKLGVLYATISEIYIAVDHLEKVIELADEDNLQMKINSLVSIAKAFGSKDENEKAYPYLEEALTLVEGSPQSGGIVHAEAMTEMAYYYFNLSKQDEAIVYYEKAIHMYLQHSTYSARKIGMIYMQYAYCLEHKKEPDIARATRGYEAAIEQLEKTKDVELLENALADVISYFDQIGNSQKKRLYENKFVQQSNGK